MEFLLVRDEFTHLDTLGTVVAQAGAPDFRLHTIELPWLEGTNLVGKSCILPGRYRMTLFDSPRLGIEVLLLHLVPGRSMVEVHPANRASELLGCIAPGKYRGPHCVISSREAFLEWKGLAAAAILRGEECYLTIQNLPDEGVDPDEGSSPRA